MKKSILLLLLALSFSVPSYAQRVRASGVLSTASATCSATTACLQTYVTNSDGGMSFTISANASGNTIQFWESADDGTTLSALNVYPSSGTQTAITSTTATSGTWTANVASYSNVYMIMSNLVGGTTTVKITPSTASARAGGGGGSPAYPVTVSGATSGGIPCFTSTTNEASSAAIAVNDSIVGGGAGACAKDSGIPFLLPNADTSSLAIGSTALASQNTTSLDNVAVGLGALNSVTSGNGNTAVGWHAIQGSASDQTATGNTAVGFQALNFPGSSNNVAVGTSAGNALRSGGSDTFLGAGTQPSANSDTNETVIGSSVTGVGSNTATIGNASVTDAYFGGSTGAAITHEAATEQTGGNAFGGFEKSAVAACETSFAATTLATGATTTSTGLSCLPANSVIDWVVARVTTTITGSCTGWSLGDGTTAARFSSNNTVLTSGTTTDAAHIGTFNNTGIASATTGIWQAAAHAIVVTCAGGNASAGAIRVIVYYHSPTAPTS